MKVIKNNNNLIKENTTWQMNCPQCSSILEYTKEDLTHEFWRTEGWTNSGIKYRGFICPCCNYEIGIKTLYAN